MGWGSEKRECRYKQTLIFHIVFFFTESWGTVVRFREKKNLVLNYGNILWNCAVFSIIFFLAKKLPKKCRKPFPYFFPPHCCLFLFFFISQSNFWGFFFRVIKSFWLLLCVFSTGNWCWKTRAEYIFFWLPKNQNIYLLFVFVFWWFLALFFQCIHANMPAKILKESILSFLQFLFK